MSVRSAVTHFRARVSKRALVQIKKNNEETSKSHNLWWLADQMDKQLIRSHRCFWPKCRVRVVFNGRRVKRSILDRLPGANLKLNTLIVNLLEKYGIKLKFVCKLTQRDISSTAIFNWDTKQIEMQQPERFILITNMYRTLLHELGHVMHSVTSNFWDESNDVKEVVAEAVSAVVLDKFMTNDQTYSELYAATFLIDSMDFTQEMDDMVVPMVERMLDAA